MEFYCIFLFFPLLLHTKLWCIFFLCLLTGAFPECTCIGFALGMHNAKTKGEVIERSGAPITLLMHWVKLKCQWLAHPEGSSVPWQSVGKQQCRSWESLDDVASQFHSKNRVPSSEAMGQFLIWPCRGSNPQPTSIRAGTKPLSAHNLHFQNTFAHDNNPLTSYKTGSLKDREHDWKEDVNSVNLTCPIYILYILLSLVSMLHFFLHSLPSSTET